MKINTHRVFVFLVWLSMMALPTLAQTNSHEAVKPNKAQIEWAETEIGAMFHFDLQNFVPDYEFREWGSHPDASVFNPTQIDTDQWIRAAKAGGAKYAVLVAKHCSGFSLWPTAAHDYSVKKSPWKNGKGDIVAEFIASCKKYGVKPGIYASSAANGYCYVDNPGIVQPGSPYTQAAYNKIVEQQLTELWGNYGKLFEVWFDGGVLPVHEGGPDLAPLLKKLQPDAIVFQGPTDAKNLIRWVGNEEGLAPYPNWSRSDTTSSASGTIKVEHMNGDPEGKIWCPGEADFPLRDGWQGGWFWKAEGQKMLSVEQLLTNYNTSVGRNANMLIGIVVNTDGRVPEEDAARLKEFGDLLTNRFKKPVATTTGSGKEFVLKVNTSRLQHFIVIQEDIAKGERIRQYVIETLVNGIWKPIAEGTSVGYKRIHELQNVHANQIRLRIIKASATPQIKTFALY